MSEDTSKPPVPVPEQTKGGKTDTDYSVTAENEQGAHHLFQECKQRLFNVNNWDKIAGALSAVFVLTDEAGKEITATPKVGNYIKIDIPGPGIKAGDGFDWVRIEEIMDESGAGKMEDRALMRVRPTGNPQNMKTEVAHFFNNEASSSFTLHRKGNTVTAGVHGRNEVPNTDTDSLLDKTRNSAIGVAAIIGFNAPQWNGLVKGIMGQ